MSDKLKTLKDLCIDYMCDNIKELYITKSKNNTDLQEYTFVYSDIYLPMEVAEKLLTTLSIRNKLNDEILSLFSHKNVYLRNVTLPKTNHLTIQGLRTLKNHNISKIIINGLKCTMNEFISSLNEWTIQNLDFLCVSKSSFIYLSCDLYSIGLMKLKNLRTLNVSNTKFSTNNLIAIVQDLPNLKSLDISNTNVNTLIPLEKKKNQLQKLSVYNLKGDNGMPIFSTSISTLKCMKSLTHLDLSCDNIYPFNELFENNSPLMNYLTDPDFLPNLVSLDISGTGSVGFNIMQNFLTTHKKLKFLGLMHTLDSALDFFTDPTYPLYNPNLVVTGVITQEQLLTSLKCYLLRPFYIQKCLYNLITWTELYDSPQVEIIQIILNVINNLSDNSSVMQVAAACLYHLTKFDLSLRIHPDIISKVLKVTLYALEKFPNDISIQKNFLLILYNDRVLRGIKMDTFKCVQLVLDSLCNFNDDVVDLISIAICKKLAPVIPNSKTYVFGNNVKYISKLLSVANEKIFNQHDDSTFLYVLCMLWDFTTFSPFCPETCKVFIDEGGLQIYLNILNVFDGNVTLIIQVLALLKNIAQTPSFRSLLIKNNVLSIASRMLLQSIEIDISYFAAGIIAYLSLEPNWELYTTLNKTEILEVLKYSIKQWDLPEHEMVYYRSFHPFIILLLSYDKPQIQLWAAWAIFHLTTYNMPKYISILQDEGLIGVLEDICRHTSIDPDVFELCNKILDKTKQPIFRYSCGQIN